MRIFTCIVLSNEIDNLFFVIRCIEGNLQDAATGNFMDD